jgi:hypothetical protein
LESAAARLGRPLPCSFAESTAVTTPDGLTPISELRVGDRVLARSEETGIYAFEPITLAYHYQHLVKVYLTLEDPATGETEVIETTPEHPFHVPGRGFVPAGSLKVDDAISRAAASASSVVRLMSARSGTLEALRVKTLTFENQPFLAYNLEVGEDHTFFVGTTRAWVHNACAFVNKGVLNLRNKYIAGSAEDRALQQHVADWNQVIKNRGGTMTRQTVSPQMRAQADKFAEAAKAANPGAYPKGMAPGHTPDVGWGGDVKGPINPLNKRVNSYVGGATQAVDPGTKYKAVKLFR